MSSSMLFAVFCLLLGRLSAVTDAADELFNVNELYRDEVDVPDKLEMNFTVDGKPVHMSLERSDSIPANPPVIISRNNRRTYWQQQHESRLAAYVDKDTQTSVVVERETQLDGVKTRRYRGNFQVDDQLYSLSPLSVPRSSSRGRSTAEERSRKVSIDGVEHVISPVSLDEIRPYESATPLRSLSTVDWPAERNNTSEWNRVGKSNKKHYKVELLVVLDYAMYKHWKHRQNNQHHKAIRALRHYFTQIVSGIDIRYATIVQSDFSIRVHLVSIFIATTARDSPWTEDRSIKTVFRNSEYINMYKALDRFEIWVGKDTSKFPTFDHATLYSSNDLFDGTFNKGRPSTKSGLANIAGVCHKTRRVSINFEFGEYASIQTGAHELGHNLGSRHDGTGNGCTGRDQYVMASAPAELNKVTFKHALTFSHCSIRYFRGYLGKLTRQKKNCLLTQSPQYIHADAMYPGRTYTADEQCQDMYGDQSFFCGGGVLEKKLCDAMQCWIPKKKICYTQAEQRAYPGTKCGNRKWCMKGKCISDPRAPAGKDSCIYGDYRGLVYIDQNTKITCADTGRRFPWKCYEKSHTIACCKTCVDIRKKDKPGCEYGDKNPKYCKKGKKSDCYDSNFKKTCCDTCAKLTGGGGQTDCVFGDKASWCASTIRAPAWQCYNQHKICCKTCKRFETNIPGCKYGDRATWCGTVGVTAKRCTSSDLGKQCCGTCSKLKPGGGHPQPATARPPTNADCPQGDQASYCKTIKNFNCYAAAKRCCVSCAKYKTNIAGCKYGDRAPWCGGYVKGPKDCKRQDIARQCCKSCNKHKRQISSALEEPGVAACRWASDAQLMTMCKDAARRAECLRCLRERVARHLLDM